MQVPTDWAREQDRKEPTPPCQQWCGAIRLWPACERARHRAAAPDDCLRAPRRSSEWPAGQRSRKQGAWSKRCANAVHAVVMHLKI